ncbi:iron-binding CDGSH zinc finger protein [Pseudomonas sp. SJZ079]|uniref:CDGSH iron-sulfur domain-containing protein n=1 Tax=Pseudomonas sp. SJZ079 TaxID=2572887 RepID=UPI00119C379A|nr:CDGSH iron-sulfur domain-containing protein [Pseudomonas sp. SJZ079]TWC37070.1 iron-binding CDGSH zinc finger protein [Pseudomonas sp. SJZ079]
MPDEGAPILPEVRWVKPGDYLSLCRCGRSPTLPDCPAECQSCLYLQPVREQWLLLCRCAGSVRLPYCDGSHAAAACSLKAKG